MSFSGRDPGGGFDPTGRGFDPVGGGIGPGGGFGQIGGSVGGGVFSSSSTELAEASVTIASPKGPLVDPDFRVEGTASVRLHHREFIKAGGQGHTSEFDTFVTDGFSVTVRIGDDEHEAQVSREGNRLHWSVAVTDVPTGEVAITATLNGTVTERSATTHGFGAIPADQHSETKPVRRTDSVVVTVDQGDVVVDASIGDVMIGSPYEAVVEGTVESEFDIVSVQVEPADWVGSIEDLSGDWSTWRAVVELPDRNDPYTLTVSARNAVDHVGESSLTVPNGEPFVAITRPAQAVETYLFQDGGITVDIEGTTTAEHATLQAVKWRLSNVFDVTEGDATESGENWSEWSIELDIDRPLTHVLEVWAVDTADTRARVTDSSTRELRAQVAQVFGLQGWPWWLGWGTGVQNAPGSVMTFPMVQFGR